MPAKVQHPFDQRKPSIFRHINNPIVASSVSAAAVATLPVDNITALEPILKQVPGGHLTHRSILALSGFILGYGIYYFADWIRIKSLRSLLKYMGWVTQPNSTKTKLWAILLSLLRGQPPYSTFQFQDFLPKQPLPELEDTLKTWLEVAHVLLKEEDFELIRELVMDFKTNEGPTLQNFLKNKATKEDSWIHDYWLNAAYLYSRKPLPVYNNYFMGMANETAGIDQLARAATCTYWMARFEQMLSEEKLAPVFIRDLVPLCMHGFRYLFNSNRVPGEYLDELVRYPGHGHIIVMRKGQYYKVNLYHTDERGNRSLCTPHELKIQFEYIVRSTESVNAENGSKVAALTGQDRKTWANQRQKLLNRNRVELQDVETAMFVVNLEDRSPKDNDDFIHSQLVGDGSNRWFDKCFTLIVYENGWVGTNVEHSPLDAMIFVVVLEYVTLFEEYDNRDVIKTQRPRSINAPTPILLDTSDVKDDISTALDSHKQLANNIQAHTMTPPYGKGFMKKQRISPDGYIQMCMQLAYFRMHKRFPKTYEPSTARMFLFGRTDTVHPGSEYSKQWVKAMDDGISNSQDKIDLLKKAVKSQTEYRLQATIGAGCDRHLLALMCVSRELGMDMPKLFTDKLWQMPFTLSTSQAPNMFHEYGCHVDFSKCFGGFGPTDDDGYGVGYCVFGDDRINFQITCWRSCQETDAKLFGRFIAEAFQDVHNLFKQ